MVALSMREMKCCPKCGGSFKLSKGITNLKSRYKNRDINRVPVLHCNVCSHEIPTQKGKELLSMAEQYNLRMMRVNYKLDSSSDSYSAHQDKQTTLTHIKSEKVRNQEPLPILDTAKRFLATVSRTINNLEKKF